MDLNKLLPILDDPSEYSLGIEASLDVLIDNLFARLARSLDIQNAAMSKLAVEFTIQRQRLSVPASGGPLGLKTSEQA